MFSKVVTLDECLWDTIKVLVRSPKKFFILKHKTQFTSVKKYNLNDFVCDYVNKLPSQVLYVLTKI